MLVAISISEHILRPIELKFNMEHQIGEEEGNYKK